MNNIAYVHAKEGRYEDAVKACNQSLQLDPAHLETLYTLAEMIHKKTLPEGKEGK